MAPTRRQALIGLALAPMGVALTTAGLTGCSPAASPDIALDMPWDQVVAAARSQRVNWAAWAGDPKINAYIAWVGEMVLSRFGITLVHAKVADTGSTIVQLIADKASGRSRGGLTDLIWINGENFIAAKDAGLLWGPFARRLPHWRLVDTKGKPSILTDFTVPNDGYESPWGLAQLTFFHDSAVSVAPPRSIPAILQWAREHPGRFTYPAPPDFVGLTFIKQALTELIGDRALLAQPLLAADFAAVTAPLWAYLDALHTVMWRSGRAFPPDYPSLRQLFEDREVDIAFAFNPAEASTAVASGLLPPTTRAYILDGGTIQNSHFVAIPFNANAKAAALVVADFILSPEAQARKADPRLWGDPTVLDLAALSATDRARFDALPQTEQLPSAKDQLRSLPEPHPSWHLKLGEAWRARYAA